jgi:outer membrane cobalamin receptor
MRARSVISIVSLAMAAARMLCAQESALELEPLEVRSAVIESERTTRFGGTVAEVGRSQILNLNADGMADALRRVTGVNISRFNNVGSYGGSDGGAFYIRGQGASRPGSEIRIYVDGAPREVGVWQHSLLDIVNIAQAERILVYKSPQPQAYGGVFGAVEMETLRRDDPGFETSLSLAAGKFDSYSANIAHGGMEKGFDYYAGYSYSESDGHRDHSAGRMEAAFARLGYSLAESLRASYIFSLTDNFAEDPGREDMPTPLRDKYITKSYDHVLRLDSAQDFGSGFVLAYYEDGEANWQKDHLDGPETPAGSSDSYWENYGLRSSHSLRRDAWEFTGGLDWTSTGGKFENITLAGKKVFGYDDRFHTLSPALAALYELDLGRGMRLRPSLGLRWYDNTEFDDEGAPHAGLVLDGEGWELHASYARGVHYPGVYAAGTSARTMDMIAAEIMDHYETGLVIEPIDQIKLRLTAFYDDSSDLLVMGPDGYINAGDGRVEGIECGMDWLPLDWMRLYLGVTLLDASPSDYPRAPETSFVGAANLRPAERWELSLDAQYVGSQVVGNRRAPETAWSSFAEVDSYLLANAKLNYDLVSSPELRVRLFTAVKNLGDTDYEYWAGYPMPGIAYMLGLESSF